MGKTPKKIAKAAKAKVHNLSLKSLRCELRLAGKETRPLCRIWGKIRGVKYATDRVRGDASGILKGLFEGLNLQQSDGTIVQARYCYLPGGIQETLETELRAIAAGSYLQFGFELSMVKSDSPMGYQINARQLFPRSARHELQDLRELISSKKSPAPAKTE